MKLAAIDFGTVTTRLLIAEVTEQGVEPLLRRTTITHLGEGLARTGKISLAAQERICAVTREYLADIAAVAGHGCPVTAVATSAMRDASNSAEVLAALRELGLDVEIIAGEREAYLSFIGTVSGFNTLGTTQAGSAKGVLVVDIGGGSTEVILGTIANANSAAGASANVIATSGVSHQGVQVFASHSFDMGSRRVSDRFLLSDPPTLAEQNLARDWITQQLAPFFSGLENTPEVMLAVAGTATSAISIRERMTVYDPARVHASVMLADELATITNHLAELPEQERKMVVGLEPERASVIVGGLLVLQAVLAVCGLPSFTVSESDILQGILLDSFERYHG